jgi:acyl carrier protein
VEAGPRWACWSKESFDGREAIATLELPTAFESDLGDHPAHPALLDVATSFAVRHFCGDDIYLPYGYRGLRISKALPRRVVSHMRYLEPDGGTSDTLRFRITVMDSEGNELVSVEEYILRRVEVAGLGTPAEPEAGRDLLRDGMSTAEGLEVFERILASGQSRVLVSTLDLEARAAQSETLRAEGLWDARSRPESGRTRHPRPSLSTPYLEATSDTEGMLIAMWESLLGIERIGIHDDFLELGGDSLMATQVTARIRSELEVELPIGALFDDPTVAGLARRIEALREAAPREDIQPEVVALEREELEL